MTGFPKLFRLDIRPPAHKHMHILLLIVHITRKPKPEHNSGRLWKSRGWTYANLDIRHNPSCTQVNNPILRPTVPSTLLSLSLWHDTMGTLKQEQLTRSSPFAPACSLSPYHLKSLASKPSLSHKAPLFSLCAFSMKWSNRLGDFLFATFRSPTLSLDFAARCCFCVCPSSPGRISRISLSPSRRNAHPSCSVARQLQFLNLDHFSYWLSMPPD